MARLSAPTNLLTSTIDKAARWAQTQSMWPATFGLACCAIEMMATGAAHNDLSRFGMEVFRASPRQADLMIVAGRVSQKMAPVLRQVYDQMPDPKWVIAMGVCSSSGGMYDSYSVVQGIDMILPVDLYVPGCPPRPDAVIDAILKLQKKIERESPFGLLLGGDVVDEYDSGTKRFLRAPNHSVPTTRSHEVLPPSGSGRDRA